MAIIKLKNETVLTVGQTRIKELEARKKELEELICSLREQKSVSFWFPEEAAKIFSAIADYDAGINKIRTIVRCVELNEDDYLEVSDKDIRLLGL